MSLLTGNQSVIITGLLWETKATCNEKQGTDVVAFVKEMRLRLHTAEWHKTLQEVGVELFTGCTISLAVIVNVRKFMVSNGVWII